MSSASYSRMLWAWNNNCKSIFKDKDQSTSSFLELLTEWIIALEIHNITNLPFAD